MSGEWRDSEGAFRPLHLMTFQGKEVCPFSRRASRPASEGLSRLSVSHHYLASRGKDWPGHSPSMTTSRGSSPFQVLAKRN
ncbi:hypothetical protein E2C01_069442 [Portunus trituberculatus]|uniref:Uncharacterized protein n=1 Tax=Portunus trituberculatus TaxID=210409 RepID=A0A5B7I280_PORTR|nr:hypothetical protein [Portunus trituberculatus]